MVLPWRIREKLQGEHWVEFPGCPVSCCHWGKTGIKQSYPWQLDEWWLGPLSCHLSGHRILPGEYKARLQALSVKLTALHHTLSLLTAQRESSQSCGGLTERMDGPEVFFPLLSLSWRRPGLGICYNPSFGILNCTWMRDVCTEQGKVPVLTGCSERSFLSPQGQGTAQIKSSRNTGLREPLEKSPVLRQYSVILLANFIIIYLHGPLLHEMWKIIILLWNNGEENGLWSQTGLVSGSVFSLNSIIFKMLFNFV